MQPDFSQLALYGREIVVAPANSLDALAAGLHVKSDYFVLGIAADTSHITQPKMVGIASQLIRRGASYVCCWGPDCSRLHDCFDAANIEVKGGSTSDSLLKTTSHEDESLEDMIWFAMSSTIPSADYLDGTRTLVIATIGNDKWTTIARQFLANSAPVHDES